MSDNEVGGGFNNLQYIDKEEGGGWDTSTSAAFLHTLLSLAYSRLRLRTRLSRRECVKVVPLTKIGKTRTWTNEVTAGSVTMVFLFS